MSSRTCARTQVGLLYRLLSATLILSLSSCATTDFVTGRQVSNMYTLNDDVNLGSNVYSQMLAEMKKRGVGINTNRKRITHLQDMVKRIAAVSHLPTLPYEVTHFQTNIVNAAAVPGGKLVVFEGLFDTKKGLVKDNDELAAVIGHEIAHVTCRHTTETLTRQMPVNLLMLAGYIWAEVKENDDAKAAMQIAFIAYQGLLLPKYSRDDETEADRVGIMYMAKAGYDPRAAVRLWKRASQSGGDPGFMSIFSTHPSNKDRYKTLERHLPAALTEYEKAMQRTSL